MTAFRSLLNGLVDGWANSLRVFFLHEHALCI